MRLVNRQIALVILDVAIATRNSEEIALDGLASTGLTSPAASDLQLRAIVQGLQV